MKTIIAVLLSATVAFATPPKLTVYYPNWCGRCLDAEGYGLPAWNVDWTGITYVVHSGNDNLSQTAPYFLTVQNAQDSINWQWGGQGACGQGQYNWQDSLIKVAHRYGTKVVLMISAVNPDVGFNLIATDSTRTEVFAYSFVSYLKRKGYDGCELDIEDWISAATTPANINRFVRIMRRQLNTMTTRGIFLTSASRNDEGRYWPSQDTAIDMHNLQCYNYGTIWGGSPFGSNISWFQTPIKAPTGLPVNTDIQTLSQEVLDNNKTVVDRWTEAGHAKSKIGISIGSYGIIMFPVNSYGVSTTGKTVNGDLSLANLKAMLGYGGSSTWYGAPHSPGIEGVANGNPQSQYWWAPANGQAFYCTFDDSSSVDDKIRWADSLGIGGFMIYSLDKDVLTGKSTHASRLPTHAKAVATLQSLGGSNPAPQGKRLFIRR